MNASLVVIGHLTNPFDLKGGFSVHFSADDFAGAGTTMRATSRGFNLLVDTGTARATAIHFLITRLSDGLRLEGFAECIPGKRNFIHIPAKFASPDRVDPVGQFDSFLHWDGTQGIFTANWTAPKTLVPTEESAVQVGRVSRA